MVYQIRYGTDGIGLTHPERVFAPDITTARQRATAILNKAGFDLLANRGWFTVHGSYTTTEGHGS